MRKLIIEVIILVIIMIGIISFTFIDHSGISNNKAIALVLEQVQEEHNISRSEIGIRNRSSITVNGSTFHKIDVSCFIQNKTQNMSYLVNANNGAVSLNPEKKPINSTK